MYNQGLNFHFLSYKAKPWYSITLIQQRRLVEYGIKLMNVE